ncbi:zinc metalloprotease HtpX [Candidatus Gracilibacteria bacterium]|nr:zinc metalloprotease HtpX [Candidatus Gracilibacteria bacterium]
MNRLKTILILGIMTGLILAGGYYLGGQRGATYALIMSAVMNMGAYWFSDKMVLALYKAKPIDPHEHRDLQQMVQQLATFAEIPMPRLYIVQMATPNAFATGRNPAHAVVCVTTGILELLTKDELRGVLAHELSHVVNRDILVSSVAATLAGALSYIAQFAYFTGGRRDDRSGFGSIIFLILTPIIATLLHLAISRSREYLADESGAKLSHDPMSLASALKKISGIAKAHPLHSEPKYQATAHMFIINPFSGGGLRSLFSTHPPVEERIKRLEAMR